jgi:general secretion pathway protein K
MRKTNTFYCRLSTQSGAAIIVALFVISLVVVISVAMMMRLQMDFRNTALLQHAMEERGYAEGSINWAMDQLNQDWLQKKSNTVVDLTPLRSPKDKIHDAEISSSIYDAQGRFNVNNLVEDPWQEDFSTLITLVDPAIDEEAAYAITMAVVDWISPESNNVTLANDYLKQNPPYRAPHRPMASVSELRLVKGMTSHLYAALSPYVTALPVVTKININNTTPLVLMSLSKTLNAETAKKLVLESSQNPFSSVQSFWDALKQNPIPEEKITVLSQYFLVKTIVIQDQQKLLLYTLLQRNIDKSQPYEMVLWQSKGTL